MRRRAFLVGLAALAGCGGAGVSRDDLRPRLAREVAQLALDGGTPEGIEAAAAPFAAAFDVERLEAVRAFYASPEGQVVTALARAEARGMPPPAVADARRPAIAAYLASPEGAEETRVLRAALAASRQGA